MRMLAPDVDFANLFDESNYVGILTTSSPVKREIRGGIYEGDAYVSVGHKGDFSISYEYKK